MDKELKKCYSYLNLPLNVNIDEVENNERALVRIFQAKSEKTKKNYDKQIKKVIHCSNKIIDNINKSGIPKTKANMKTPRENVVITLFFVFIAFLVAMVISFINLL